MSKAEPACLSTHVLAEDNAPPVTGAKFTLIPPHSHALWDNLFYADLLDDLRYQGGGPHKLHFSMNLS